MSPRHLGLFDTPPGRSEIRLALLIVGLLLAALALVLPLRDIRLPQMVGFIPAIDATICVADLIIGTLLLSQASVFRSQALTVLGSGYVLAGLFLIPHALTFPGAFAPDGWLGAKVNTTAWLGAFRRVEFPIVIILYALMRRADAAPQTEADKKPALVGVGVLAAVVLAASGTLLATVGHDLLPPLFQNSRDSVYSNLVIMNCITIVLTIAGMALLFRPNRSVLDLWLMVALAGWLVQSLLNLPLRSRFTFGAYSLQVLMLASSLVVMLALITEAGRLYARLSLSVVAMEKEFESRLMSMDAVAAVIGHEVGQPLTALNLNARAGIDWLSREPPNPERAIASFEDAMEAGRDAAQVIRTIRASFAEGTAALAEFDFNELVRETADLLDLDLTAQNISLKLDLDESLPPIQANRVQIQRVIVNLLTNAIASMAATLGPARQILIRSRRAGGDVLLHVADAAAPKQEEAMARDLEPAFTTKAERAGLGLPLARTIVAAHGGRLWASTTATWGAMFDLRLPLSPLKARLENPAPA